MASKPDMALLILKNKGLLGKGASSSSNSSDSTSSTTDDSDSMDSPEGNESNYEVSAEEILSAIEKKDAKELASLLKDFVSMCDDEEDKDEPPLSDDKESE